MGQFPPLPIKKGASMARRFLNVAVAYLVAWRSFRLRPVVGKHRRA